MINDSFQNFTYKKPKESHWYGAYGFMFSYKKVMSGSFSPIIELVATYRLPLVFVVSNVTVFTETVLGDFSILCSEEGVSHCAASDNCPSSSTDSPHCDTMVGETPAVWERLPKRREIDFLRNLLLSISLWRRDFPISASGVKNITPSKIRT